MTCSYLPSHICDGKANRKASCKPQKIAARCHKKVNFNSRGSSKMIKRKKWEIKHWLTLHAFVWCSPRGTPCVSACSGSGCCWAAWRATTRPSTSVLRPGGQLSWLNWGWKDERNQTVLPLYHCVAQGMPQLSPSSTCMSMSQHHSFCPTTAAPNYVCIIPLRHLL